MATMNIFVLIIPRRTPELMGAGSAVEEPWAVMGMAGVGVVTVERVRLAVVTEARTVVAVDSIVVEPEPDPVVS